MVFWKTKRFRIAVAVGFVLLAFFKLNEMYAQGDTEAIYYVIALVAVALLMVFFENDKTDK